MADRPDWSSLNHAYGKADDIPQLPEQSSPDETAEVWHICLKRPFDGRSPIES